MYHQLSLSTSLSEHSPTDVMLRLRLVLNQLRGLLMLRMLRHMLIQVGVRAARASFAVAVANGHATDDVLALRSMRRAIMRRDVAVRVLLTARVCLLHRLYDARRRLCAAIQSKTNFSIFHTRVEFVNAACLQPWRVLAPRP